MIAKNEAGQTRIDRYLADLLDLEATDLGAAISIARGWKAEEVAKLTRSDDPQAFALYMAILRLSRVFMPLGAMFREVLYETATATRLIADDMDFSLAGDIAPEWDSCIPSGHGTTVKYQGLSVLGGQTGTGKSKLATHAALMACSNPTTVVVYLCAELDLATSWLYAHQVTKFSRDDFKAAFPNFRPINTPLGCTFDRVVDAVCRNIPDDAEQVIIVADTINTLCENCQEEGGDGYFATMRRLGMWMLESRKRTEGRIGWLAVSELAGKDQHILGARLDKWGDKVVRFQAGDQPNQLKIDVVKDRYGGKVELGQYFLDWQHCTVKKV